MDERQLHRLLSSACTSMLFDGANDGYNTDCLGTYTYGGTDADGDPYWQRNSSVLYYLYR